MAKEKEAAKEPEAPPSSVPAPKKAKKVIGPTINRTIRGTFEDEKEGSLVRMTFSPGDEAELAKHIDADEIKRLTDKGAISGFTAPAK
jgi:hypothetical protein